jgi:hypothetical protein
LGRLGAGTNVFLSCPQFFSSNGEHFRRFLTETDITERYGNIMEIQRIQDLGTLGGRKFLVWGRMPH